MNMMSTGRWGRGLADEAFVALLFSQMFWNEPVTQRRQFNSTATALAASSYILQKSESRNDGDETPKTAAPVVNCKAVCGSRIRMEEGVEGARAV
jgi:hypothetical protein